MRHRLSAIIPLTMLLASCASSDEPPSTTSITPEAVASTVTAATPSTTAPAAASATTMAAVAPTTPPSATTVPTDAAVLLEIEAEWHGSIETITLYEDGTLVAGTALGDADIPAATDYFASVQSELRVVDLGADRYPQAILVSLPWVDSEDPPNVEQLFVQDGDRLRRVFNDIIGAYGVSVLEFMGDGTIEYREDGYTACAGYGAVEEVVLQYVTLGFVGDEIAEVGRRDSPFTQTCGELAG